MIHKTAIVDVKAKISDNVKIGPYCFIGPEVEIGANSVLHSHVNIVGNTKIGKNNQIYPFSSIGTPPQDLKYKGEKNSLIIGNNNKFREYVNINPGTEQGGGVTTVGDNNFAGKVLCVISMHFGGSYRSANPRQLCLITEL